MDRTALVEAEVATAGSSAPLRLACLGDSITRAQFSADYLDLLRRRRPGQLHVARFGVNGDFAANLRQRLGPVLADPADVVTVLIGTNDARASLPGYPVDKAMKRKRLTQPPSAAWFQDCLLAVVGRLTKETDARIGVLSLPVLGQDLDGPAVEASTTYSRIFAEVAAATGVAYLPLHERQLAHLRQAGAPPIPYREATPAAVVATLVERAVLRRSLDAIARRRGLVLTTDHVHQNSLGAGFVADVIEESGLLTRHGHVAR